jgi:LmbE family N-acetylglucosaminyl deacetylase
MKACVIVAHPDDETLWAGGTVLARSEYSWTVLTVCRRSDPDRAPRFFKAVERLGAKGLMADLDDGPDQRPLDAGLIRAAILDLLPRADYDLLVTHSPFGEYTRHRRHEETSRAVTGLWERRRLTAGELWLFAYEDGGKQYLPRPIERAHLRIPLEDGTWKEKVDIIQNIYGFRPDSWEAGANPRLEAFWRFSDVQSYRAWLEKEKKHVKGGL